METLMPLLKQLQSKLKELEDKPVSLQEYNEYSTILSHALYVVRGEHPHAEFIAINDGEALVVGSKMSAVSIPLE